MARRVAVIRSRRAQERPENNVEGDRDTFYVSTQAPVIQTREIVSRISMRDGTVVEEAMTNRFVMARTVATQTLQMRVVDTQTDTEMETEESREVEVAEGEEEGFKASTPGTPLLDENDE